jgi:isocitrate/isopropylmalate dehydrogenase
LAEEAATIEQAVKESVVSAQGTAEIGGSLGTKETGDYIDHQIKMSSCFRGEPNV